VQGLALAGASVLRAGTENKLLAGPASVLFGIMPFDVFISYSSKDKATADAACAALETAGIRCWIAPRDVRAGTEYAEGIIEGIDSCRIMVLIFSSNANASPQIHREIERAVSKGLTIIPFRIEEIEPTKAMEYYLGAIHWLDALTPPLAKHLERLVEQVGANLKLDAAATSRSVRVLPKVVGQNATRFLRSKVKLGIITTVATALILGVVGVYILYQIRAHISHSYARLPDMAIRRILLRSIGMADGLRRAATMLR
jgi:hypothetical protein